MTHTDMIAKICTAAPVIPVLTIDRVQDAQPLARALVAGGLPALEITLRTDAAMEAIAAVAEVEGALARGWHSAHHRADPRCKICWGHLWCLARCNRQYHQSRARL